MCCATRVHLSLISRRQETTAEVKRELGEVTRRGQELREETRRIGLISDLLYYIHEVNIYTMVHICSSMVWIKECREGKGITYGQN